MAPKKNVYLIGFSGSGKSTVGPLIARKLKMRFYDTDIIIRRKFKKTIERIFRDIGEKGFRQLEEQVIYNVVTFIRPAKVVALGGGAFQNRKVVQLAKESGIVVFLSCSQAELFKRMNQVKDRPLLKVDAKTEAKREEALKKRISSLMRQRQDGYTKADIKISTSDRTPVQVTNMLVKKIKQLYADD
ncbi:MAG TPA: shikimate kinase [candidate division Zixibacteria bacterium]|nr:shikimate kinase [candidate division Zixibacteria bacterium]